MADSAVEGHGPSSWEWPTAMSMPVLMGDSWPFKGCRTVAEDPVDAGAGAEAQAELVVLCEMEAGWIWWRGSIHGGDCGSIIEWRSSEPRLPTVLDADHDKILS